MAQLMSIKRNVEMCPGQVSVPAIYHVSQGDKGTRIILGLVNNSANYTIPDGTTATIRGHRADGTLFTEITADVETTEVKFNLTEDMSAIPGRAECEAVLASGSANIIGTANFIIDVEKSPASIGSVFPATDAAETWLRDELANLDISGLDDESVVDAINSKLGGTFETTDAGKVLMVNQDGTVSPAAVDLSGKASESTIAPEFDSSASYTAGQYVYKNGVLYRFTQSHSGAWTGTDAEAVTVGGRLSVFDNMLETIDLAFDETTGKIYVTINGLKKGNGVQITEPGYIENVSSVVQWYRSQVQYAYNYVKNLPDGTVSHIMVTDLHYDNNFRNSAAICNLLMDTGKFDKLLIMGDLTDDNTDAQYSNFISDGWGNNNGNIIFALGNHDVRTPTGGYPTYQDFYEDFLSDATYAQGASGTLYYTYTDNVHRIKYVVLNTETITASSNDPQLIMIREAVQDSGYDVFVLAHRNLAFGMNWAQELGSEVTAAITEAIESGSANIIGYLCGHQHVDYIAPIDSAFYLSTWLCDRNETTNYYPGYSVTTRKNGTWSAQAITIISINPQMRNVKFMRVGAALNVGAWQYDYAVNGAALSSLTGKTVTVYIDGAYSSNKSIFINSGDSFETVLTPEDNYYFGAIIVTMGSTDISSSSVNGLTISIPSVTDNVMIKCMALPLNTELISFPKVSGGTLTSYNESTGEFTFSGGNTSRNFIINALKSGDVLHLKYSGTGNCTAYTETDVFANTYSGTGTNLVYGAKGVDREFIVPSDCSVSINAFSSGTVSCKKVLPNTGELFTSALIPVLFGDATYTFNQDGSVTIGGTPSGTSETNCVKFVVPVIAGATYDLSVKSSENGYAFIAMMSDDTNTDGNYTVMGGTMAWSPSNFTYTTINATKEFSNTVQTGRGKMIVRLNPATTYTISIKLHQSE